MPSQGGKPDGVKAGALAGLPADVAMARLPPGRHGLPRSFVADNQRARIVAGMLRALPQRGYPGLTIGHITAEAGVSRSAFYQQFESKEACFLTTYEIAGGWFCERVERAVDSKEEWADRVRAGVAEALDQLAGNPLVAHLFAVEAAQAGPAARDRQQACHARLAAILSADIPRRAEVPPEIGQLLFGGTVQLIARHVDTGRADQLPVATADLVERVLIPYLGQEGPA